jgi:gluconate 2-dehydrogenase gamma chain
MTDPKRRDLLATSAAVVLATPAPSVAAIVRGGLPWTPGRADPPAAVKPGPWEFFTADEGATVEALVDRLIPPDPETPGGKDSGCAVFIDRQLAGPYGSYQSNYMKGPFQHGTKEQGDQSPLTPSQHYRLGLAALEKHCQAAFGGSGFAKLTDDQKDNLLKGIESGSATLPGVDGKSFFSILLIDTQQGFFADPIYGGNRDMVAWKMIGYPGARYDYRDWVLRHNERYPLPPIGISDHPDWNQ